MAKPAVANSDTKADEVSHIVFVDLISKTFNPISLTQRYDRYKQLT